MSSAPRPVHQLVSRLAERALYEQIDNRGIGITLHALIGLFMIWLGKYRALVAIPTAIAVPIFFFVTFERWFLVPLPKGPIEKLLGF